MTTEIGETVLENAAILDEIAQHCPDIVLPTGYLYQKNPSAILQSKDGNALSATFAIVTRTATPNRYGNQLQLLPNKNGAGPVTDYYAQNPVVLYDHGISGLTLPVGLSAQKGGPLALAWSATQGIATCYFSSQSWAEPVYAAVDEGLIKMASIGFDPILGMRLKTAGPANPDGAAPRPSGGSDTVQVMSWLGMDFVEWELLEWSITPVGADRGALRQSLDRGSINGIKLPAFLKQSFSQHAAEVKKLGIGFTESQRITSEGGPVGDAAIISETQAKSDPKCTKCGSVMQCMQCMKQSESEPEPDIAPDMSMSYLPAADSVAQACAAQIMQSQRQEVERTLLNGIAQVVKDQVAPIANTVAKIATDFKRMRGRLDD